MERPCFFLDKNSAELMKNTTGEVGVFVGQVLIPIAYLFTELAVVISLTTFLIYIEPLEQLLYLEVFYFYIMLINFLAKVSYLIGERSDKERPV